MSAAEPVLLAAIVADHERPMVAAAAEQLSAAVARATGAAWPIRLRFLPVADARLPQGAIIVTSLAIDFAERWTTAQRTSFWRMLLASPHSGCVFLCTLFRHVVDRHTTPEVIERIRQLDLFAIRLSRETGVALVDLDRLFALYGACELAKSANAAAKLGGRVIAEALIAIGLDDHIAPGIQRRAAEELIRSPIAFTENERLA